MTTPIPIDLTQFNDKIREFLEPFYLTAFQAGYEAGVEAHKNHVVHIINTSMPTFAAARRFNMRIEEISFVVRTYNCLKRGGINTIGELIVKDDASLLDIPNLGQKNIEEIDRKLAEIGLFRTK